MEDSERSRLVKLILRDPELSFSLLGLVFWAVVIGFVRNPFYLDILIMILLWAMLASSWNIAGGYAGMFSLGHGAFIGIGAYASSMLFIHFKLSPWIGMLIGATAAGIVASFLGYICGRLKGHYFALATIAFVELANITGVQLKELTRGSEGLSIPFSAGWANFMFESKVTYAYLGLIFMVTFYFLSLALERSKLGYYLVAMREDEDAAKSLAINTPLIKMMSIGLSGFLAAIGGTFYAQYILFIEPDTVLSFNFSVQVALVTIVGGMGTALGPIIGSFLLTPLSMLLRAYLGGGLVGLHIVIYGFLLIIVVFFIPDGIVNSVRASLKKYLKEEGTD
ncbi:MAG TPA: branched-chain amino acid ABC transporter permease [Thermodesulfobacteriota bacterium]|nr:branched-chain amino acid ABC transporter permease [Thermodesulfobacteriota bacterium]